MAGEIFISYRRSDQARAALLHRLLKERGVEAWYDALLGAGEDWRTATAGALEKAPIFVLLFSQAASESTDIAKELAAATLEKKLVVPVRIENIRPKGAFLYELASRNWVDAYEDTEAKLASLADTLAALVKGGSGAEAAAASLGAKADDIAAVKPATRPLLKRPGVLGGITVLAIAVAAGLGFMLTRPGVPAEADNYRIAFFGFTAPDSDPVALKAADVATEEGFRMMERIRLKVAPRAETASMEGAPMLDRAAELDARFVVDGEIRREGGGLKSVIRMVDVPTRTTLWQSTVDGLVAQPDQVAYGAGVRAASASRCVISNFEIYAPRGPDAASQALIGRACQGSRIEAQSVALELLKINPDNGLVAPGLAENLVWNIPQIPMSQRPGAMAEAEKWLQHSEKIAPDSYLTAIARTSVAVVAGKPPLDWLPQLETAVQRMPTPSEAPYYARAAAITGQQVLELGLLREASRYFAVAAESDPAVINWEYYLAVARAASGQYGSKDTLERLVNTRTAGYNWEVALTAAIFLDAADPQIILAAAPADVISVIPCYQDLIAALKLTSGAARLDAAKRADSCLMSFDSPHVNIIAQSALGNLDRAFEIADRPDYTAFMWGYWSPLFIPTTSAMRADPRFLPMVERWGYMDYWRETGLQPDICATPAERDIPLCVALRETR
jgi:TolB-like protein